MKTKKLLQKILERLRSRLVNHPNPSRIASLRKRVERLEEAKRTLDEEEALLAVVRAVQGWWKVQRS